MSEFLKRIRWSALVVAALLAALGWLLARFMGPDHLLSLTRPHELQRTDWVLVLVGAAVGYALIRLRPLIAIFSGLSFIVVVIFVSRAASPQQGIGFAWIILFIQIAVALICAVAINIILIRRENRRLAQALEAYFAPDTAKKFTALRYRKLFDAGTERRKLTLLFSDPVEPGSIAAGHRTRTTALPKDPSELLRGCVHANGGTIVKTEGGRMFAIWNAPELQVDHATRACKAALRLRKRMKVRIGLHTGAATVGNFGTATQINYTATGDYLELTSRVAALNKLLGTEVLVSSETKREMSDHFVTRYLGNFRFKDFSDYVGIYELMGADDIDEMGRSLRDSFEQAVYSFQGSDVQEAESAFRRVLDIYPDDQPAQFYMRRIEAMAGEPWPYDWNGTVNISDV